MAYCLYYALLIIMAFINNWYEFNWVSSILMHKAISVLLEKYNKLHGALRNYEYDEW